MNNDLKEILECLKVIKNYCIHETACSLEKKDAINNKVRIMSFDEAVKKAESLLKDSVLSP